MFGLGVLIEVVNWFISALLMRRHDPVWKRMKK